MTTMANPNPSRITDPMWRLWTGRPDTTWKLGGIFANKRCYHNTVEANLRNWPGAYCVVLSSDLVNFNRDKARAIDYTMSDAKMRLYTGRLRASALDPDDDRLTAVREFYGTLNSSTVYGLIKSGPNASWKTSSADSTHLWHIHISIFTRYVNDWDMLRPILSVLSGETYAQWKAKEAGIMLPSKGDSGPEVAYWQRMLLEVGEKLPQFGADGDYGDETVTAVDAFRRRISDGRVKGGNSITAWTAIQLQKRVFEGAKGDPGPAPTAKQIGSAVESWMESHSDSLKPTAAEVAAFIEGWLETHKEELRGEPGKTPTKIAISGDVVAVQ